ncbi:uncharacterized protein TRAVEDRAFT_30706 [Trametes versicolor FP-101664 SS1]|uniref:uncharacterized protein n=1 Tax=Trametes versicolor (strain FP-101664) TaxID=717944 RepID=UPI000462167F|nr:uncharacterized protein TRAVEDRAFT_30706 [Trametes versicolor FP-101664 SS1]EIW56170.1 hypothetical protein TRAVEDRAFT_30706 [Trametes versicolor FP-101664 SS1]
MCLIVNGTSRGPQRALSPFLPSEILWPPRSTDFERDWAHLAGLTGPNLCYSASVREPPQAPQTSATAPASVSRHFETVLLFVPAPAVVPVALPSSSTTVGTSQTAPPARVSGVVSEGARTAGARRWTALETGGAPVVVRGVRDDRTIRAWGGGVGLGRSCRRVWSRGGCRRCVVA